MIEKEIFLIGVRKIHSEKKQKDYYMVDYVYIANNTPKTDYITIEEYKRIGEKGKPYTKYKGLFNINNYDRVYLSDIKQ